MKRIFALMLALLMLSGCTPAQPPESSQELTRYRVELEVRQLLGTEEGLLFCSTEGLTLLSRTELEVIAKLEGDFSELAYVQVLGDRIYVADPGTQCVTVLGQSLEVLQTIPVEAQGKSWLVCAEGRGLCALSQEGITLHDLTDGSSRELLRCRRMGVLGIIGGTVRVAAVGSEDLLNHWYRLELADGSVTELDGEALLALQAGLSPQADGSNLCVREGMIHWYDAHGGHLSSTALPEDCRLLSPDFVWDETRGGWFFPVYTQEGCELLFWEPIPNEGESLALTVEEVPEGSILPRELYDRAAELSERFGLDIRVAERAARDYGSYDSGLLTDPELTAQALELLEEVLAKYPEGFFAQLRYGNRRIVRIELVDGLKGKAGHDVSSGTSAFTVRRDQYCMIVLNARRIRENLIYHEFSHIIDDRLSFEAGLRPDALYSEEAWLALQPEGFRYADSYQSIPQEVEEFYDSGYFAGNYACVSATEDRAETMEAAAMGDRAVFDANPHLLPKLEFYAACIRDSFDTTGWPEKLPWERLLP